MTNEEKKCIDLLTLRKFQNDKTRNKMVVTAVAFTTLLFIISLTVGINLLKVIQHNNSNIESITVNGIQLLFLIKLIVLVLLLFICYLIINSIYNATMEKDVQFYGLSKLIGATRKQIFKIIFTQFLLVTTVGVIIGIIASFILASFVLPSILKMVIPTFHSQSNIGIYIYAAIFSYISTFTSMLIPAIKVMQLPAVKSIIYSADLSSEGNSIKPTRNGGKIHIMAWRNIWRKSQRTWFTVIYISLSLMCLHSAFMLIQELSARKYVSAKINTDFIIGTNKYFQNGFSFMEGVDVQNYLSEMSLDQNIVKDIKRDSDFKEGGAIYLGTDFPRDSKKITEVCLKTEKNVAVSDDKSEISTNNQKDSHGNYYVDLYGADDFSMSKLELIDGVLDWDKLKSGKYIIYALPAYDFSNPKSDYGKSTDFFNVGDTITLLINNKECKYEIMAKAVLRETTAVRFDDARQFNFYLPSTEFLSKVNNYIMMSYLVDAKEWKISTLENVLMKKTSLKSSNLSYKSKSVLMNEFYGQENILILLLVFPGIIFGAIGILNLVNSIISSILNNSKEIATLRSIGMTSIHVNKMIFLETVFSTFIIFVTSILFISLFEKLIYEFCSRGIWYYTYKFNLFVILPVYPIVFLLSIILRKLTYEHVWKKDLAQEIKR